MEGLSMSEAQDTKSAALVALTLKHELEGLLERYPESKNHYAYKYGAQKVESIIEDLSKCIHKEDRLELCPLCYRVLPVPCPACGAGVGS
jgi:hypothetical protein